MRISDHGDGQLLIRGGPMQAIVSGAGPDMRVDGRRVGLRASLYTGDLIHVATANACFTLPHIRAGAKNQQIDQGGTIAAPMHGKVSEIDVQIGDRVTPDTRLAVLEAMKLQHEIRSDVTGTVSVVHVLAQAQVKAGDRLIEIDVETP